MKRRNFLLIGVSGCMLSSSKILAIPIYNHTSYEDEKQIVDLKFIRDENGLISRLRRFISHRQSTVHDTDELVIPISLNIELGRSGLDDVEIIICSSESYVCNKDTKSNLNSNVQIGTLTKSVGQSFLMHLPKGYIANKESSNHFDLFVIKNELYSMYRLVINKNVINKYSKYYPNLYANNKLSTLSDKILARHSNNVIDVKPSFSGDVMKLDLLLKEIV
ncbi:hypothetical protein SAMN04488136_10728 [Vibrio xiamenensis]|uniref:Uncharacterized protein n=1 Tax=Vibrio xiamenensis TaxID=861298 RepID=A0A1G7Z6L7_9VIBR|nr:hypothetical protein [Vibrio xiamenensis]SDH04391.1 hypothetical protein SAMN04488136_10728 [Vibrio xiamenensis]